MSPRHFKLAREFADVLVVQDEGPGMKLAAQVYCAAVKERLNASPRTSDEIASELHDLEQSLKINVAVWLNFAYLVAAVETCAPAWGLPLPRPIAIYLGRET